MGARIACARARATAGGRGVTPSRNGRGIIPLRGPMTAPAAHPPRLEIDSGDASRLRLSGRWTLNYAAAISACLTQAPRTATRIDATGVERLDSLGVLQLMRFAERRDLDFGDFSFDEKHRALVSAIEDVPDDRPRRKREYGLAAGMGRL